jgi:hypothetical protein
MAALHLGQRYTYDRAALIKMLGDALTHSWPRTL